MFSNNFKKLREEKNITQKELSGYLGVSDRAVGYYETGQRTPPPDILEKIADFFGVSVDFLLGRTDIRIPYTNQTDTDNLDELATESLSKNLKKLRTNKNLTQEEVSKDLNINRATYAHYETGRREPDINTLELLAQYYKVSIDQLLGVKNVKKTSTDNLDELATEVIDLLIKTGELTEEEVASGNIDKDRMENLLKNLKKSIEISKIMKD